MTPAPKELSPEQLTYLFESATKGHAAIVSLQENSPDKLIEVILMIQRRDARIKELELQVGDAHEMADFYANYAKDSVSAAHITGRSSTGMRFAVDDKWGDRARAYLARWHGEDKK